MKGIVYKITNEEGICYVGSTIQPLNCRMAQHKSTKKKQEIFDKKYTLDVLEEGEYTDLIELRKIEKEYIIENRDTSINKVSISTDEELHKRILDRNKIYTAEHKEDKRLYDIEYRKNNHIKLNCECGGSYYKKHKAQHFKTSKHLQYMKK